MADKYAKNLSDETLPTINLSSGSGKIKRRISRYNIRNFHPENNVHEIKFPVLSCMKSQKPFLSL